MSLDAGGADHHTASRGHFGPLQIRIFAISIDGIIVTTQKLALVGGHRLLAA